MKSALKGVIGFGLVSIPVRLHAATEEHGVPLHQVHAADSGRIRMKRTCEKCGKEVEYADVAKGYQDRIGRTAVLTDADLAGLPLPSKKLIDVLAFVDIDRIDPLALSNAYYLEADTGIAAKPYVLLREALKAGGKAAVTRIALRSRESLALLRVHGDALVLHTMHWPDDIRPDTGFAPPGDVTVRPQELKMAASLMHTMSENFDLQALHDDHQHALDQLVAARLQGQPVPAAEEAAPAPETAIDLTAALRASIDARAPAKPTRKTPAKNKAAKRPSTRRGTAAKRATTTRTAPKRPRKPA